jgi:vitamin B12 transporter
MGGRWANALTLQGVDAGREGFSGGALAFGDEGSRLKASYVASLRFGSDAFAHTLTGAIDYERERFANTGPFLTEAQSMRREIENLGLVGQYDLVVNDRLGLGFAVRHDDNDSFDDATTYRAQGSYLFDNGARVHAAFGSGVKNPGVFELYGFFPESFIGNPNLKPERSEGWEAGLEQSFVGGAARIDVVYFDSTLKDEIFTVFGGPPLFLSSAANRATESTQAGVEVAGEARIGESWRLFAAYTFLDAEENGEEEVRRPPHIASLNLSWRSPGERYGGYLTVRYNGETLDNNFTLTGPPRVRLPAYTLVNVGGDVRLTDKVEIYARVENALDEEYEEVYTYRSPGRAGFVGLRLGF